MIIFLMDLNLVNFRSYLEGLDRGYFTKDPSDFYDAHVCDPYINKTMSTST